MEDKSKLGTIIDGIAASEHLDSSGEILDIKGMDISSLGSADSILNFEHNSKDNPSQICGKITYAKKIFKKSDCDNERQEYFWEICKKPFVYVKGELFDHADLDHDGARNIAALLRYDNRDKGKKTRKLISFSIEGGKIEKEGVVVKKSIARDVALTVKHCNKMCIVEILDDIKDRKDLYKNQQFNIEPMLKGEFRQKIFNSMKKNLPSQDSFQQKMEKIKETNSFKQKEKNAEKLASMSAKAPALSSEARPKRQFSSDKIPNTLKVGDKIVYDKPKMRTGKQIYNDPNTWKDNKNSMLTNKFQDKPKMRTGAEIYSDPNTWKTENNMRRTLMDSIKKSSPDTLTNTAALTPEELEPTLQKPFKSKAQRRFAYANKEKFGGKEGIKEWEEKTPKSIPEKVKKNENIQKGQAPLEFTQMAGPSKPHQDVKTINDPFGAEQLKRQVGDRLPDTTRGVNVSSYEDKTNRAYDFSPAPSKEKLQQKVTYNPEKGRKELRGNFPTTKFHEMVHNQLRSIEQKHPSKNKEIAKQHTNSLLGHIFDNYFHQDDIASLRNFLSNKTGYGKQKPQDVTEEMLTHLSDFRTSPEKRNAFNKFNDLGEEGNRERMKRIKQGFKKLLPAMKNLSYEDLERIHNERQKKLQDLKNKKVEIQKIPPGVSGIKDR